MRDYDPIRAVRHLRSWVEESLSSPDIGELASVKARYRKITKVIDQLKALGISASEDIQSEKKALEQLIDASDQTKKLRLLGNELAMFARDIDRHLRKLKGGRAHPQKLRVAFPDGAVIIEKKAVDTFVKSIQWIGLERVSEIKSVKRYGHPIVSRERNKSAGMVREVDGYFIETKSSTKDKAGFIRDIARALGLEIEVDLIDS